ncbi:MAG: S8 family serine peptidase [Deltaproteobacteria bacterium]|nr:S8 family serine peptidase [Deltaproteobacteria bacterium]
MRFRGQEYTGKGQIVAIVDSGVDARDPRLAGASITGWNISLNATAHALLASDYADENGHGTEIAAAVYRAAPGVQLMCIKIMDAKLRTSADLMAAAIETAARNGARVINLSLGTPNMGKALLLRDCCALAVERGAMVIAAAHPKGERAYPADLPEAVGVAGHPDCPMEKFYYFAPHRFPARQWGNLSGKFLGHGYTAPPPGADRGVYKGSGLATANLSGRLACLREALGDETPVNVVEHLRKLALTPVPEIGYA